MLSVLVALGGLQRSLLGLDWRSVVSLFSMAIRVLLGFLISLSDSFAHAQSNRDGG